MRFLLLIILACAYPPPLVETATFSGKIRQAPFCIDETEPDLANFRPIFDYHNKNPEKFVPVSPDTYRSPTGFVKNVSLHRISIEAIKHDDHPYKVFDNFFHIEVIAATESTGMEGLFIQAISAPIGVPFGEFITDFDCGDCAVPTSTLAQYTAVVPCKFLPAASYMHPQTLAIGGRVNVETKFKEAHFNFRYVDYPCYDVIFAQFLIIAVQSFNPLKYDIFYTSIHKVGIEGVGAPYPMYYGWETKDVKCHDPTYAFFHNWVAQKNQKVKVKYSPEYEKCIVEDNAERLLGPGVVCPPGPVTCSGREQPPKSVSQWRQFREKYDIRNNPSGGVETFCQDCGTWEDHIGKPKPWPIPPVVVKPELIDIDEDSATKKPYNPRPARKKDCEDRDEYGKNKTGGRDLTKYRRCDETFEEALTFIGWQWGSTVIKAHGLFMLFTWNVACNCFIYCARFLKESSLMIKYAGCFSIGKWLWAHILLVYVAIGTMWTGVFLFTFISDVTPICMMYHTAEATQFCLSYTRVHEICGILSMVIFHMGLCTGWWRPENPQLRKLLVGYHAMTGYLAKYIGLLCLATTADFETHHIGMVILAEVTFWLIFIAGTFIQRATDAKLNVKRGMVPVPEAIDTFIEPPLETLRRFMFPLLFVLQVGIFVGHLF